MKIAPAALDRFLQAPPAEARLILVYGPDTGAVAERARRIARATVDALDDPFRVAHLSPAACADDLARLPDEMAALSLGGGMRLVWIKGAGENVVASLNALIELWPDAPSRLIIEAGDLDKRSKLRALFEGSDARLAAIACYTEEGAQRKTTIQRLLADAHIAVDRNVLERLDARLPPDRAALTQEIEKIALFALDDGKLTLDELDCLLPDSGDSALDDLVMAVASGQAADTARFLDRLLAEALAPVALFRALQRHFLRLQLARAHLDAGLSPREAVAKLSPRVFWKHEASFAAQVQRWPAAKLEALLTRLFDAEASVKQTGAPDEAICRQLVLQIALL
jgi:DNA polymerase-3 subunit delta